MTAGAAIRAVPDLLREPEEIEAALVGALMLRPDLIPEARRIVEPGDVYRGTLGTVYAAILAVTDAGGEADLLSVVRHLRDVGELDRVGGAAAVAALPDGVPRGDLALGYGRQIAATARRRRAVRAASGLVGALADRDGESTVRALLEEIAGEIAPRDAVRPVALAEIAATPTEYAVRDLIPRVGLVLLYAAAGVGKTYAGLTMATELLASWGRPRNLFEHPDLGILTSWRSALWISSEETGGTLRARWDRVLAGLHLSPADMGGPLLFRWASDPRGPVTLDRVEDVLDAAPAVDAVFCDSVTAMLPASFEGRAPEWDADNHAVRHLCARLRAIAVQRNLVFLLVHHSGKDEARGARGPSEWRNSCDTVASLKPAPGSEGEASFRIEKQKDARGVPGFTLHRTFDAGAVTIRYGNTESPSGRLTDAARAADAYMAEAGTASQKQIERGTGLARSTVQRAAADCMAAGLWRDTGNRVHGSPIFARIRTENGTSDE